MTRAELKDFLDEKVDKYNRVSFIEHDPIQIPHRFHKKEDIEIAAFLTATITWGNRKSIINNASRLMELMDNDPHDFIQNFSSEDHSRFKGFVHRTFNATDVIYFLGSPSEFIPESRRLGKSLWRICRNEYASAGDPSLQKDLF